MNMRQSYKNTTKQVRINSEMHRLLKIEASRLGMTLRDLLEAYIADILAVKPIYESN